MGDVKYNSVLTVRLGGHKAPESRQGLSVDAELSPTTTRRKSSAVRFMDKLTTTISYDDDVDAESVVARDGEPTYLRSQSTNHNWSSPAIDEDHVDSSTMVDEQTRGEGESAPFHRWRTNRKKREAKMEQNINWLRDEIVKLKHQDQSLMRQFLQLRSVIYQLKGTVSTGQRPVAKLPRITGSMDSLARYQSRADGVAETLGLGGGCEEMNEEEDDEVCSELDDQTALMEDPYLPEFRGRTVSLLNPGNITRTRDANRGNGYMKSRTMSFSVGTASARELDRAIVE